MALKLNPMTGRLEEEQEEGAPLLGPAQPFEQGPGGTTLQIVAPPEETSRVESGRSVTEPQTTTTTKEPGPLTVEAEDDRTAAIERRRAAQEREHGIAQIGREAEANYQGQLQTIDDINRLEKAQEQERSAAFVAQRQAEDAAARESHQKLLGTKEERSFLKDVAMAFMLGLAQSAHIKAGGQGMSPTYKAMEDSLARRKQAEIDELTRSEAFAKGAAGNLELAKKQLADRLAAIDVKHEGWRKKALAHLEPIRARLKLPAADAEFERLAAQTDQTEAEGELKRREKYDIESRVEGQRVTRTSSSSQTRNVGGAGTKPPTEGEAKFGMYSAQMKDALDVIERSKPLSPQALDKIQKQSELFNAAEKGSLEGLGGAVKTRAGRAVGLLPKNPYEGLTAEEQQVATAMDTFVNAELRTESGAALGEVEIRRKVRNSLPVAGEDPAVSAAKIERLKRVASDFGALGGKATERIEAARAAKGDRQPPRASAPEPEPPPKNAETARDLAVIENKLRTMKKDDPERPRWEALKRTILGK